MAGFFPVWLPAYIKLKNAKGATYDSYNSNIQAHILPYFGDKAVRDTTPVSISAFIEHLKKKPCGGSKAYNKKPEEIETLGPSSIKKCFDILSAALSTAKEWKIIAEIPEATPPSVKDKKRAYWTPQEALSTINSIDAPVLRLGVHLAYVLTLRPGEVVGIPIDAIQGNNIEIRQETERMTDKALKATAKEDIIRVFSKKKGESGTQLVLLTPKTEVSVRRLYLNKQNESAGALVRRGIRETGRGAGSSFEVTPLQCDCGKSRQTLKRSHIDDQRRNTAKSENGS